MKFSEKLQYLRKENKLSQENLADMLDVSRQSVSKWESGQTYPEMDKLIAMCKIFKCSLDDLTNDEIKDIGEITKSKNNISNIIDELLELINRTFTMLKNMKFKDIIKLIFQMGLVAIILLFFHLPVEYLYSLCRNIFMNFGTTVGNILSGILNLTLNICYLIIFVVIFVYIYKIRFLDKYNDIEIDNNINNPESKTNEIEQKIITKNNEKNVQPKKQHSYAFFNILGSLFIGLIKFFVICIAIPFIFSLLFLFAALILCLILMFKGVFYLSILLGIIAAITINIILLAMVFYFIFNKKIDAKKIFITSISSIALLGVSIGIGMYDIANFKYIDDVPRYEEITKITNEFKMTDESIIYFHTYYSDINYIEKNDLSDKIIIETELYKNYSNIAIEEIENDIIISNDSLKEVTPIKIIDMVIEDLANKEFHNYNKLSDIKINIYTSKENIQKLRDNMNKKNEREYCDELREENYSYEQEINSLQNRIFELEDENSLLNDEIEEYKMKIQEYKDNIKGLLDN